MAAYISFQPTDFFNTLLYAGTSATWTAHSGLGFQPNFTWHKSRTSTGWHGFCDSVRGVDASSGCKAVYSNSNIAEESSTSEYLDGYQSDGFTVGLNGLVAQLHHSKKLIQHLSMYLDAGFFHVIGSS